MHQIVTYFGTRSGLAASLLMNLIDGEVSLWSSSRRSLSRFINLRTRKEWKNAESVWILGVGLAEDTCLPALRQLLAQGTRVYWLTEGFDLRTEWPNLQSAEFKSLQLVNVGDDLGGGLLKACHCTKAKLSARARTLLEWLSQETRRSQGCQNLEVALLKAGLMHNFRSNDWGAAFHEAIRQLAKGTPLSDSQRQTAENQLLYGDWRLIGSEGDMSELQRLSKRAAQDPGNCRVLIQGETGSGKELVARQVHFLSKRRDKNFLALNCANLTPQLMDSELFGSEKGAFTGATESRPGLVQQADGGTLFLDEIGELAPELQAKLLRVLETGLVRPVGGRKMQKVDVRILAATHRTLTGATTDFRQDLYHRLAQVVLHTVPLRSMTHDDREELLFQLTYELGRSRGLENQIWSEEDHALLHCYAWPGNVRELGAIIVDAMVMGQNLSETLRRRQGDQPAKIPERDGILEIPVQTTDPISLDEVQRRYVQAVAAKLEGNKTKTAEVLGLARATVQRYLRELEV